jgi:uncharacterized membrane protein YphA (DoxX/SURF4 family)
MATLLASSMVVALMTADKAHFLDALFLRGDATLTDITPFVYLLFLIWLVLLGPGVLSLDTLVSRALGIRPVPADPGKESLRA